MVDKRTTELSLVFVLVGMMSLVPIITGQALASVNAVATIEQKGCEPFRCTFTVYGSHLDSGKWVVPPTASGNTVRWKTTGNPPPGNEDGVVNIEAHGGAHGIKHLVFHNPVLGVNSCKVLALTGGSNFVGSCDAGSGQNADFTYTFRVLTH
jgi:hypothetical protein